MKKALALILTLIMVLGLMPAVLAATSDTNTNTIDIPVTKEWSDEGHTEARPENGITVKLYKGETQLGETTITADATGNWSGAFTVNKSVFSGDTAMTYNLTLVETPLENYTTAYTNPQVKYTPFTVGKWDITHQCNVTTFDLEGSNVFVGKQTGNAGGGITVWTADKLTDAQKQAIYNSASKINGMGNPNYKEFTFISGTESHSGAQVINGEVQFTGTSKWAIWARSSYELEKVEVESDGTITNTYKEPGKISINVQKEWDMKGLDNIAKPNEVTIKLFKGNENTGKTLKLNQSNQWKGTFANLDVVEDKAYRIEEEVVEGYTSEISSNTTGDGFTVKNTLITYPVQIKKEASGLSDGTTYPNVTVDIKQGDKVIKTITGLVPNGGAEIVQLPAGKYTVEEQEGTAKVEGYNLNVTNAELKVTAPVVAARSTAPDAVDTVTATVINKYTKMEDNTGSLIVKKTVSGNGADFNKAFTFKVTLTLPAPTSAPAEIVGEDVRNPLMPSATNITYDDIKDDFVNYSLTMTFCLSHGKTFTITGLPAGTTYTVTEDPEDYTSTVPNNANGAIGNRETVSVTFDNYKSGGGHYYPTPDPVPPIVIPPKTGDMTIWQSILHFLGIR